MNAEPPDRSDLPQPNNPAAASSRVGAHRSWPSPSLLWPWLGVNALGFAVVTTILIQIAVVGRSPGLTTEGIEALFISGILVGGFVGSMQALILRKQVPRLKIWQWILASMFGGYLGIFVGGIALMVIGFPLQFVMPTLPLTFLLVILRGIYGAAMGASVGWIQAMTLAPHVWGLRRWWVASAIGRSLGWVSTQLLWMLVAAKVSSFPNSAWHFLIVAFFGLVGGLIYGVVTARALPRLTPR